MNNLTGRERILRMLKGQAVDRTPLMPITMMFAADRIGAKYGQYAADYRVLVEAQLRTAEEFDFDYVSCISDPAREVADCGGTVRFFDDQPPAMDEMNARLADKADLAKLRVPDPLGGGRMHDRVKAAALFKEKVAGQRLIEGWIEGPCAEAADLRGINSLMMDFFDDPAFVRDLMEFVLELELRFAKAQIEAGAEIMGIGDAAASLVGPEIYNECVAPFEKRMIDGVHAMGCPVRLHICGNMRPNLAAMGRLGADMIDLDYPSPVDEARKAMGAKQVLLGNIHPVEVLRKGPPEAVRAALEVCHQQAGDNYILGAGCEIPRDTPASHVNIFRQVSEAHRRA